MTNVIKFYNTVISKRENFEYRHLENVLDDIRFGTWRQLVEQARALESKADRDTFKTKHIPAFQAGESPFVVIDWETSQPMDPVEEHILFKFRSVSGNGWAVGILLESPSHA